MLLRKGNRPSRLLSQLQLLFEYSPHLACRDVPDGSWTGDGSPFHLLCSFPFCFEHGILFRKSPTCRNAWHQCPGQTLQDNIARVAMAIQITNSNNHQDNMARMGVPAISHFGMNLSSPMTLVQQKGPSAHPMQRKGHCNGIHCFLNKAAEANSVFSLRSTSSNSC